MHLLAYGLFACMSLICACFVCVCMCVLVRHSRPCPSVSPWRLNSLLTYDALSCVWWVCFCVIHSRACDAFRQKERCSSTGETDDHSSTKALWFRITKNPDWSTRPLSRLFACSLVCSLTPLLVGKWMIGWLCFLCFFSVLDHSGVKTNLGLMFLASLKAYSLLERS